jgi:hypothetical protein
LFSRTYLRFRFTVFVAALLRSPERRAAPFGALLRLYATLP